MRGVQVFEAALENGESRFLRALQRGGGFGLNGSGFAHLLDSRLQAGFGFGPELAREMGARDEELEIDPLQLVEAGLGSLDQSRLDTERPSPTSTYSPP